jgi:hypothetical protein
MAGDYNPCIPANDRPGPINVLNEIVSEAVNSVGGG